MLVLEWACMRCLQWDVQTWDRPVKNKLKSIVVNIGMT